MMATKMDIYHIRFNRERYRLVNVTILSEDEFIYQTGYGSTTGREFPAILHSLKRINNRVVLSRQKLKDKIAVWKKDALKSGFVEVLQYSYFKGEYSEIPWECNQ